MGSEEPAWSNPGNVQSGVVLLLSCAFCDKEHIHWRLDPGQGAVGRFGGVRGSLSKKQTAT